MTDTLILFKPLADFGEALKKDCPKNDCTSYLYTYEQYCAIYADYKRIKETIADLSEATVRVLEHAIRKTEAELYKMWFENYAVLKQRAALGMAASEERRATSSGKTNFEAITAGASFRLNTCTSQGTDGTIISRSAGKTLKRGIGAYKILMTIREGRQLWQKTRSRTAAGSSRRRLKL